jgi:hypothetical protein
VKREQAQREKGYRDQALAMFPHVCARCGREFSGARLRELTVHHLDNDHMNNPPDGSNWQLLCLYCHDDAHGAYERTGGGGASVAYRDDNDSGGFKAFEGLKDLLKPKDGGSGDKKA